MARRVPGATPRRCQVLTNMNSTFRWNIVSLVSAWALGSTGCASSAPEPAREQRLSVEEMQAAIDLVETTIADVHLSAIDGPPGELDTALTTARAGTSTLLQEPECFLVLSETTAGLHDAHSRIELDPSEGERLDLPIAWLTLGPAVVRDAGDLRRGDLVLRIGSRAAAELLADLGNIISHENEGHVRAVAPELVVREAVLQIGRAHV